MKITIPVTLEIENLGSRSEEEILEYVRGDILRVLEFNYSCSEFLGSEEHHINLKDIHV